LKQFGRKAARAQQAGGAHLQQPTIAGHEADCRRPGPAVTKPQAATALLLAAGVRRKAAILEKPSGDYHLLAIKKPAWAADERRLLRLRCSWSWSLEMTTRSR
jgi:hypothetical protein